MCVVKLTAAIDTSPPHSDIIHIQISYLTDFTHSLCEFIIIWRILPRLPAFTPHPSECTFLSDWFVWFLPLICVILVIIRPSEFIFWLYLLLMCGILPSPVWMCSSYSFLLIYHVFTPHVKPEIWCIYWFLFHLPWFYSSSLYFLPSFVWMHALLTIYSFCFKSTLILRLICVV